MAELPTNDEIVRAVLDMFKTDQAREGDCLRTAAVMIRLSTGYKFRNDESVKALEFANEQGMLTVDNQSVCLTAKGFAAM